MNGLPATRPLSLGTASDGQHVLVLRNMTSSFAVTVWLVLLLVVSSFSVPAAAPPLADGLGVAYKSPPAPPLTLEGLDGESYDLVDYRGRVVVINFWATWCPPCIAEMPAIQSMWEKLNPAGLEVLAINTGESSSDITAFLSRFEPRLTFPILLDATGDTYEG